MKKTILSLTAILVTSVFTLQSPRAGTVGSDGGIELRVSFRYDAGQTRLAQWKAAFEDASRLIYDATDGKFYIKRMRVCNNSLGGKQADIFIFDGRGRAFVGYPSLKPGEQMTKMTIGINMSSVRIYHYQDDIEQDVFGPVTIGTVPAHELAHYVFGVLDEYKGPSGYKGLSGPAECVISPPNSPACLMENYYNRSISEFCVSSNHDLDDPTTAHDEAKNTDQSSVNRESCWETIARIWGVEQPSGLPTDASGDPPPLDWEELAGRRAMLVIDRSGSMADAGKIDGAKTGASLAVDLLKTGDEVGVVSFSSSVTTDFPLTKITDESVKTAAKNAINQLNAAGSTNIGGGLRAALDQLRSQPQEACVQFIILLSDGMHNTGEHPDSVIPDLKAAGVPVFTIALGSDADTTLLSRIATETGGKFLFSPTAAKLSQIFATFQSEAFGNTLVTSGTNQVGPGQEVLTRTFVDGATTEVSFILTWPNSASNLDLSLITPSGTRITPTSLPPNVQFFSSQTAEVYRVSSPAAGSWQLAVRGVNISGSQQVFDFQVFADSPSVLFEAEPENGAVVFPEPILITAHADYFTPVTGLTISGTVTHPDGRQTPIMLFDDGLRQHGDLFAGDGMYAGLFNNYTSDGTYTFALVADNMSGTGVRGIGDQPFQQSLVPAIPFIRETRFSVVVSGVVGAVPPSDSCRTATEITLAPFTQTSDTVMATSSPDDPLQSCTYGGPFRNSNSVWYKFTPAQNGTVTVETTGSNYDTVLSAYTGTCGALTEVACNDDTAGTLQSRITFDATAGTTYLIEVTQFGNPKGGTLVFSLNFTAATLNVSPNSLTFNGVVGQGNPAPQAITVRNTGGGSLSFSISSSDAGLVSASPSSGTLSAGQSATVQVSVTNPNVAGTRTAMLTITAPGAQNSPQQVSVTVNIAPPPTLSVSPTSLTFNAVAGQGNPPSQTITVRNTGGGSFSFNITSSNPGLVSASPTSDTLSAGQSRTVQVLVTNPNVAGTQTATLTVTAPGAQNSPQQVTVRVVVEPQPKLNVTPTSLTFNAVAGQGDPPSQTITVRNTGGGSLSFNIASSDPRLVSVSPSSGTLSAGQSRTVQVSVTNPNVAGTQTATLTITAPGAQNSPQFVSITIVTTACPQVETEPNDSPQQANPICTPEQGQSVSITGNATPSDGGTTVDQLIQECNLTEANIHDWFRFVVTERGAFQVSLNFSGSNIDYNVWWFRESNDVTNFPLGVQLFGRSVLGVGQPEQISTQVLEPGTYYIGVMRVRRNDASDTQRVGYTLTLTRGLSPEMHAVEDAACVGFVGPENNVNGLFVVNRVRPTQYPARLESIGAMFFRHAGRPSPHGRLVRIIAFTDPSGSGTPPPNRPLVVDQTIPITIPGPNLGQFNVLTLGAAGPVIHSGDFYVGYVVDTSRGIFPDVARVLFPEIRSFASQDGGRTYQTFDIQDTSTGLLFNVLIRAIVNTNLAGRSSTTIQGSQDEVRMEKILIDRPRRKPDELFE